MQETAALSHELLTLQDKQVQRQCCASRLQQLTVFVGQQWLTWNSSRSSSTQVTSVEPPGLHVTPATIPVAGSSPAGKRSHIETVPWQARMDCPDTMVMSRYCSHQEWLSGVCMITGCQRCLQQQEAKMGVLASRYNPQQRGQ